MPGRPRQPCRRRDQGVRTVLKHEARRDWHLDQRQERDCSDDGDRALAAECPQEVEGRSVAKSMPTLGRAERDEAEEHTRDERRYGDHEREGQEHKAPLDAYA